jgi:decaprenylphospho-beta-D-erythro-pentofuranosid-2-ulose 2-reductase
MPRTFQRAIIIGASSGIGEALAAKLTAEGCRVALVARRLDALQSIAAQLNTQAQKDLACVYAHDVREITEVPALFAEITQSLGGLDLIVYAAGIMPRLGIDQYATDQDADTITTNFTGAVAWLNEAAQRFGRASAGTIVGISSVAGDRGRRGNAVYGATKAALNAYLESLFNRLARKGVVVVNVKPGPVETPMTTGLKMPGMAPVEQVAGEILLAAHAGTRIVYTPARWRLVMRIICAIPAPIFKYLPI